MGCCGWLNPTACLRFSSWRRPAPRGSMSTEGARGEVLPLFRPEVLNARREQAAGTLLLVQPISSRLLTLVAMAVAAALIVVSFKGEYTRKARVTGYLVPTQGLIKIYSRDTGTIIEKRVVEGQQVSKDD